MAISSAGRTTTSALQDADLVRVDGAESLLRLQREAEKECAHRGLDDHVGEGKRLHDRVHDGLLRRDVSEDGRLGPGEVADREQQDVARGLHDRQADDEVDEVPARDDPVEADEEDPCGDRIGQEAHSSPGPVTNCWSRNSEMSNTKAPATSSPTEMLSSGIIPAESRVPGSPSGRKL